MTNNTGWKEPTTSEAWRYWIEEVLARQVNELPSPAERPPYFQLDRDAVGNLSETFHMLRRQPEKQILFRRGFDALFSELAPDRPDLPRWVEYCVRLGCRIEALSVVPKFRHLLIGGPLRHVDNREIRSAVILAFGALSLRATSREVRDLVADYRASGQAPVRQLPTLLELACQGAPDQWHTLMKEYLEMGPEVRQLVRAVVDAVKPFGFARGLLPLLHDLPRERRWPIVQAAFQGESAILRLCRPDDPPANAFNGWMLTSRRPETPVHAVADTERSMSTSDRSAIHQLLGRAFNVGSVLKFETPRLKAG